MPDVREQIIARLVEIAQDIDGIREVYRNVMNLSGDDLDSLPLISVLDGDEEAIDDQPSNRPATVARRVEMSPLMLIAFAEKPETLGTDLNTLRRKLIKAVVEDTALKSLVDRFGVRYDGMQTPVFDQGRLAIGRRLLRFTFTYLLIPHQL